MRCGACGGPEHGTSEETRACRERFWLAALEMRVAAAATVADEAGQS